MKSKITMLLAFVFLAAYSVNAQMQRMSVEDRVKAQMERLEPLKLTDEQKAKTSELFTNFFSNQQKSMQAMREKGERPDRSVFQKATEERNAELKKIFTKEQFKQFQKQEEEMMRQRQQRQGQGQRGGRNG